MPHGINTLPLTVYPGFMKLSGNERKWALTEVMDFDKKKVLLGSASFACG